MVKIYFLGVYGEWFLSRFIIWATLVVTVILKPTFTMHAARMTTDLILCVFFSVKSQRT